MLLGKRNNVIDQEVVAYPTSKTNSRIFIFRNYFKTIRHTKNLLIVIFVDLTLIEIEVEVK